MKSTFRITPWAAVIAAMLSISGSAAAQGLALAPGAPIFLRPTGFDGAGFDSSPSAGRLDSDVVIPLGTSTGIGFGGSCTTGCANPGVRMPNASFVEGIYALEGAPLAGRSVGLQSGLLNAVGLRVKLSNRTMSPIASVRVVIQWGARSLLGLVRGNLRVEVGACDGSSIGPPRSGTDLGTESSGRWLLHRDAYTVPGPLAPGADICLSLTNTALAGIDIVAITELRVEVPTCGNGSMETGEACDSGGIDEPCACDPVTCQIPAEGSLCPGEVTPCSTNVCRSGRCTHEARFDGEPVEGCEDGDPCTFDACSAGNCLTLTGCIPANACLTCEPLARTCDVPIPGCCLADGDCPEAGPCGTYACVSHTCELSVIPDCRADAELPDVGVRLDAAGTDGAVAMDAGNVPFDVGPADVDGSSGPMDGSVATYDTQPPASFGGGGGCRCNLTGRGDVSGWALLALGLAIARRRARAPKR